MCSHCVRASCGFFYGHSEVGGAVRRLCGDCWEIVQFGTVIVRSPQHPHENHTKPRGVFVPRFRGDCAVTVGRRSFFFFFFFLRESPSTKSVNFHISACAVVQDVNVPTTKGVKILLLL